MYAFGDTIKWVDTQNDLELLRSEYAELKQDHIEALAEIERLKRIIQDRSWRVVAEEGNPAEQRAYLIKYRRLSGATVISPAIWGSGGWYIYGSLYGLVAYEWADILDE